MINAMVRDCQRVLPAAWLAASLAAGSAFAEGSLEVGLGSVGSSGHLQTPAGGQIGTASAKRPTLAEAALDGGHYRWLAASANLGRGRLHLRYADIAAQGTSALANHLVAQSRAFDAGETIRSRAAFDTLTLAWTWRFEREGWRAELGPQVRWTAFDLRIDGTGQAVDRRYRVYAVGAFGILSKQLGQRFNAVLEATAAPAFDGAASAYALAPSIEYRIGERLRLRLGARFEAFGYDDAHKQTLPNDLNVRRRLLPTLALRARW